MKTEPIVAAAIRFVDGQPPASTAYGDIYHPREGAIAQARHVFLAGNDLPGRWHARARFVILETGFGLGNNFLATWQAWRDDPQRPQQLVFVSFERHPPSRSDLHQAHGASTLPELADALVQAWPPLTPNVHVLDFEDGAVRLLLVLGDAGRLLLRTSQSADAVYLDGFAPDRNPQMWSRELIAAVARRMAPGGTLATWCVAREVREHLRSTGFEVTRAAGFGGKRDMCRARYVPAFAPRRSPSRQSAHEQTSLGYFAHTPSGGGRQGRPGGAHEQTSLGYFAHTPSGGGRQGRPGGALEALPGIAQRALIIGAGLAGACAAEALARQGWLCTVVEQHRSPAEEASGNPGGLFHGTAHAVDGPHARFTRAAALLAAQRYRSLVESGRVSGQLQGLLRSRPAGRVPSMPSDFLQALDIEQASALAGLPLQGPAWLYPGGGWVAPRELCAALLDHPAIDLRLGRRVATLAHKEGAWCAFDDEGQAIDSAPVLILAIGTLPAPKGMQGLPPRQRVRGQVSWFASAVGPARPLNGEGYALALGDGRVLFGATSQPGDDDPTVRESDHRFNRRRLESLAGLVPAAGVETGGRTAWRSMTGDRLPLIGAVPLSPEQWPDGQRADQCRFIPRQPGLYLLMGLASRGLTWGPLAGETLAAWISGAPMPLETDLLDAIDPARHLVRLARRPASA